MPSISGQSAKVAIIVSVLTFTTFSLLVFLSNQKWTCVLSYTNADMPEFRKYMQLTVILAKQISQLEDHDDDVALLPQIYPLIEEERRLHTFDNDI